MVWHIKRIQLAEDQKLRTGSSGVDVRVEAGDISGFCKRVAGVFKDLLQIGACVPFPVSGLGMHPDVLLCREDLGPVRLYKADIFFGVHIQSAKMVFFSCDRP